MNDYTKGILTGASLILCLFFLGCEKYEIIDGSTRYNKSTDEIEILLDNGEWVIKSEHLKKQQEIKRLEESKRNELALIEAERMAKEGERKVKETRIEVFSVVLVSSVNTKYAKNLLMGSYDSYPNAGGKDINKTLFANYPDDSWTLVTGNDTINGVSKGNDATADAAGCVGWTMTEDTDYSLWYYTNADDSAFLVSYKLPNSPNILQAGGQLNMNEVPNNCGGNGG
jgi:hypothetical protein|tara:strand:- start:124 stop:804 length:681 start_codon:yes stop_codon:yes gene_type:complete